MVIIDPRTVATATLIYSAITFVGMALFGVEKWCERGETFGVLFNMLSRISPLEVRDGKLGTPAVALGRGGVGAACRARSRWSCSLIAGTTYDGAAEGVLAEPIDWLYDLINGGAGAEGDVLARRLTATHLHAPHLRCRLGHLLGRDQGDGHGGQRRLTTRELGRTFAFCFIPIAFAYMLAHYFSLVVFQEQAQFTYLLSDPLGEGSDYFGTASGDGRPRVISSEFVWYVQVGALVVGHVAALAMGHDKALAVYKNLRRATQSQYWMLALMVSFTVLGLALLSAANQSRRAVNTRM